MILDLPRFLASERSYWDELDELLGKISDDPYRKLTINEVTRLHYLYTRASSGLARLSTFSAEPQTREYLESLIARAYAECHANRGQVRFRPWNWFVRTFPQTFRKHARAFQLSVALTLLGAMFGCLAISIDRNAKAVLMPFGELLQSPVERVKHEESVHNDRLAGQKETFSAELMTHNIQVALMTFAMGITYGVGSSVLLFYNGVTLGAVAADYVNAGMTPFLLGWILPHGVIEIPAILIAGQAAFVLASALIGWGQSATRRKRLREVLTDMLTLAAGAAVMLVWAGIVEAFLSQYHHPVLPYSLKIAFGLLELAGLSIFLSRAGRA